MIRLLHWKLRSAIKIRHSQTLTFLQEPPEFPKKMPETSTTSPAGDHFAFLPQGGIIQKFVIGGHNVVLGFDDAASYAGDAHPFFGETIGRVANRIANAEIKQLNGRNYKLAANNGPNTLHGGTQGWGKKIFEGPFNTTRDGRSAIRFTYRSADGEEGFPGMVEFRLWYIPSIENDGHRELVSLEIEYEAELVDDQVEETVISLTNHR